MSTELAELRSYPPDRKVKGRELEEYRQRDEYLEFEVSYKRERRSARALNSTQFLNPPSVTENALRHLRHAAASKDPKWRGGPGCIRVPAPGGQRPAEGTLQPHAAGQQPDQPDQPGQQHQGRGRQQQNQRLQQQEPAGGPETQLSAGCQEVRPAGGVVCVGSGTVLHCRQQAASLRRFFLKIQEGLELRLKGGQR